MRNWIAYLVCPSLPCNGRMKFDRDGNRHNRLMTMHCIRSLDEEDNWNRGGMTKKWGGDGTRTEAS